MVKFVAVLVVSIYFGSVTEVNSVLVTGLTLVKVEVRMSVVLVAPEVNTSGTVVILVTVLVVVLLVVMKLTDPMNLVAVVVVSE